MNDNVPLRRVIILGDTETDEHRDQLDHAAAVAGATVIECVTFPVGAALTADDLTEVGAAVTALGAAISACADVWVPFPVEDLAREQHWRRLALVLQRRGRDLLLGPRLVPTSDAGGSSPIDAALRAEVRAVDDLDRAALAAASITTLEDEIQQSLTTSDGARAPGAMGVTAPEQPVLAQLLLSLVGALEKRHAPAPRLPAANAPWEARQPMLKRYAGWLVGPCGQTQAFAAGALNALGHRTRLGREWHQATVSALVNGRYDRGVAA